MEGTAISMKWREVCEADLPECLGATAPHLGGEIVGRKKALAIWKDLVRSPSFSSVVIASGGTMGSVMAG
jgi:hypothetical protein